MWIYVWSIIIYVGEDTDVSDENKECSFSTQVVLTLSKPLLNKGYCPTMDNYYNSPELGEMFLKSKINFVGTLRPNRKYLPKELKTEKLKKGDLLAYQRGNKKSNLKFRIELAERIVEKYHTHRHLKLKPAETASNTLRLSARHFLDYIPATEKKKEPTRRCVIAKEQDSPNESTPVSKRSRRWKTSKNSDAMDTDADPSDTDYVTDDVKVIIHQYHPVCVALQETFLKSCHTTKIRRYGCVRKNTEGSSVSGSVCIFTSLEVPSSSLPLRILLQAVAVRIHSTSLITVCCRYLPSNAVIHQQDLSNLVDQLPAPFVILGDFNGHSTLWGSVKTNPRGRQFEQVLSDHCLCLLNHEEPTYFHEPTRSFHTLDLAICSPSLFPNLNLSVEKDLYNSDHFPVILSHDSDTGGKTFPPTYSYTRADWALFTQLAVIPDAMVKTESVDTAVQEVTNVLIAAADLSIPKISSHLFQRYKPWWNTDCQTAYKNQRKLWESFVNIPLRRISWRSKRQKQMLAEWRQSHRQSWIRYVSSRTSSTSSKQL
ncbi:putative RNA-directed DNA polymerase from transposon X-element [Trichonephila clavipes]|nr:putative RNA-directed DNA polymerase from transposon X-element [Trichonephila clavipes]